MDEARPWHARAAALLEHVLPFLAGIAAVWWLFPPELPHQLPSDPRPPTTRVAASSPQPRPSSPRPFLELINAERRKAGLAELAWDDRLERAARLHSEQMKMLRFFEHEAPDGTGPAQRVSSQGVAWNVVTENIARDQTVPQAHSLLMSSVGHRANILDPRVDHMGAFAVLDGRDILVTQVFTQVRHP